MPRALVTGGLGFIGAGLARRLVRDGWQVTLLDARLEGHGGNRRNIAGIEDRVRVHVADARDAELLADLIPDQDVVFHLAGQRSHLDSMRDPRGDLEHNCGATIAVLEACRRLNRGARLVFTSTRQVYGRPERLPVDEAHVTRPVDVNGVHKLAAEQYFRVYAQAHGIRSCVLRLTNTYGPGMRIADERQGFLGLWIRRVLEGEDLVVFGDGSQRRDFNYLEDVVDALVRAAASERAMGEVINLGAEPAATLREVAETLIRLNGAGRCRLSPFPPEYRAIDIGDYAADFRKAASLLGWRAATGLAEGLSKTLDYYRAHGVHYRQDLVGTVP